MKKIGIPVFSPSDFEPHPAGSLFLESNVDITGPVNRVAYMTVGARALMEMRLIEFQCAGFRLPKYFYRPMRKSKRAVTKEVLTILDLMRAGGEDVDGNVEIDL